MQSMRLPIVVLLAFIFLSPALAAVNISSCGSGSVITTGDIYTLNASLSGAPNAGSTGTACIVISSSNVLIDCQGYSITHDDSSNTAAILVNQTTTLLNNITIRNCNIRDYGSGIMVDFNASSGNRRGVALYNNTLTSNAYGVNLPLGHVDITLNANTIANNTITGYNLGDYFGDTIDMTNDRLLGNGADINYTAGMSGFTLDIQDVVFGNAAGSYYVNTTIYHPSSSRSWGLIDWVPSPSAPSSNHVSFLNKSLNLTPSYLDWEDDFTVTMRWANAEAGSALQESAIQLWLINDSGSYLLNTTPDISNNVISATVTLNDSVSSSVFALYRNNGCPVISSPGIYTLANSLSGAPNNGSNNHEACVLIASDDVVFDCAGYAIDHDDTSDTAGIMVNGTTSDRDNITIRNCPVSDYDYGILIDSVSSDRQTVNMTNNTLTSNAHGIFIPQGYAYVYTSNNLIANNTNTGFSDENYFGDIINMSQDRFLGNSRDIVYPSGGSQLFIDIRDVILGNADGSYGANLTINHSTSDATRGLLDWVPSPTPPTLAMSSFFNKSFNLTNTYIATFGSDEMFGIKFKWGASEGTALQQSLIQMWLYNESGYFLLNASPDTSNREISVSSYPFNDVSNSTIISLFMNPGCPVVNSSGTYVQSQNFLGAPNLVNGVNNVCLVINASDVDWDCNGYNISNNGTDTSFGIYVTGPQNNVTIRNCANVSDYVYGIYVFNTTNATVRDSTAGGSFQSAFASVYSPVNFTNNYGYGSGNGFYLASGSNATNCIATGNTRGYYYDGSLSTNIRATNNTASQNSLYGFYTTFGANGNIFTLNRAFNNSNTGFYIGSNNNNFSNNTVYFNTQTGFELVGTGNLVENNTIYNNTEGVRFDSGPNRASNNDVQNSSGFGFISTASNNNITGNRMVGNGYGVDISLASGNLISGNNISYGSTGIAVIASINTTLFGNSVFGNSQDGFYLSNSNNTTVTNDHAYANQYAFYLQSTGASSTVNLSNVIIDRAAGDFQNYTNLSLNDSLSGTTAYRINWTTNTTSPGSSYTSLLGKLVSINTVAGSPSLDRIVWHYLQSDVGSLVESRFVILKYNGSWTDTLATLDNVSNTLALTNMAPASDYGIFEGPASCPVITSSGSITQTQDYVGSPNVVSGGLACVVINADNVEYNCNGYRITGNGSGPSTFGVISDYHRNVTIRNCVISNYSWGIEFHSTNNSFILNNTVFNNTYYGLWLTTANPANGSNWNLVANNTLFSNNGSNIYLAGYYDNLTNNTDLGGIGNAFYIAQRGSHIISGNRISSHASAPAIYLDNSSLNIVRDNAVSGNQYGIAVLAGSTANLVSGNNVTTSSIDGIILQNAPSNNVTGNTVNSSSSDGIDLSASSNCRVYNNTAYGNTNYGFLLESVSSQNNIYNNTAYSNMFGFGVASSPGNNLSNNTAYSGTYGFAIAGNASTGNLFFNNTAYSHSSSGFDVMGGAFSNRFIRNNVYSNAFYGFWIETLANNNTYSGNNVSANGVHGFFVDSSSDNLFSDNLVAGNTLGGIYTTQSSWNNLTNNTATGSNNYSIAISHGSGNRVLGNTVTSNVALAGALFFQFTSDNTVANNSVTGNTNDGLYMGYTNFSTVSGNNLTGNHNGANIQFSHDISLIDNNLSSNGANGLSLLYSVDVLVDPSVICNNAMTGIYVFSSNSSVVANNTLCNNGISGAVLDQSYDNLVSGNNLTGNAQFGLYLANSSLNRIELNRADGNGNSGFGTAPGSSQNNFTDNTATVNGVAGYLISSDSNIFARDNATGNGNDGFQFGGSSAIFNTLSMCNASSNGGSGFYFGGCHDNTITGCDGGMNTESGFEIGGSQNHTLLSNTARLNGQHGFMFSGGVNATAIDNLADSNALAGFMLGGYISSVFTGNNATGNYEDGFWAGGTSYSNLTDNLASANLRSGFNLSGSSYCRFISNAVDANAGDGFFAGGGAFNVYDSNAIGSNILSGMNFTGASDSLIVDNNITGNGINGVELWGSSRNNLTGNRLSGHNANVFSAGSSDLVLEDNVATGPSNLGIQLFASSDAAVSNNTLEGNAGTGLMIEGGSQRVNATGNNITGNEYGIYLATGASDARLRDNTISNSGSYGIYVDAVSGASSANDHMFNNVRDFRVVGSSGALSIANDIFDNPAGDFASFTNLSLNDSPASNESYSITWMDNSTTLPLPTNTESFAQKFVNITALAGTPSIDSIVWSWREAELAPDYQEPSFRIYEYDGSWTDPGATLDTGANTLSLAGVSGFSAFAILQYNAPDSDEHSDEVPEAEYSVSIKPACNGFIVSVKDGGSAVVNALITGTDRTHATELAPHYTNASGQAFFPDCDIEVSVKAAKSGRSGTDSGMAECGFCPECATDDDCELSEQCSAQVCVPVNCPKGRVVDHACELYECMVDADCPIGQSCVDHSCRTVYECDYGLANTTADDNDDCADDEYCNVPLGLPGGSCKPITGCGEVGGHRLTQWECGDLESCPACPSGSLCVSHECVQSDLTCPSSGIVGDRKTCKAVEDNAPCVNCDYIVTDPSGKNVTGKTDAGGNLNLPLNLAGDYKIALLKDGQTLKAIFVKALPQTKPVEPEKPPALSTEAIALGMLVILLAALAIFAFLYWRRRQKGKKAGPKSYGKK